VKTTLTPLQLKQAREWLADCSWPDLTSEEALTLDDITTTRAIAHHFDGGLAAFVATCEKECGEVLRDDDGFCATCCVPFGVEHSHQDATAREQVCNGTACVHSDDSSERAQAAENLHPN
jgi:hypothetical protein